jgi:glycosyltransferase involved in cell wall biosynthesis
LKVLIVTPHIFAGGAEKVALHSAQQLELMGCEVSIVSLSVDLGGLPEKLRGLRYILPKKPLKESPIKGSGSAVKSMAIETSELSKLIRAHAKDFDVLNPFNFPSYWATFLAQSRKPVVWTCSEVLGPYRQTKELFERSAFFRLSLGLTVSIDTYIVKHGVDEIVTYSALNSQLIMKRFGLPSTVIPACVDFDFFSQSISEAKAKLGFQGTLLLLHVGWLVPSKNQIVSIQALHILKQKVPTIKLVIVGTGSSESFLRHETERLGLKGNVVFMDVTTQEKLRLLYQACDFNLYPVKNQTFGLVPFEVLAAGKPSIVSDECGAADVLRKEKIAFLISPSADALAGTLSFALDHPEQVKDMVERGQRYVRDNLTWERYAKDLYSVFRRAVESKHK